MLSRRNIRVKVLQSLYSYFSTEGMKKDEVMRNYDESIENAYILLHFQLYLLCKISEL